jgi:hypothetical protein
LSLGFSVGEPTECLAESINELFFIFGVEGREPFCLHDEPEFFYRVKVSQVQGFTLMP